MTVRARGRARGSIGQNSPQRDLHMQDEITGTAATDRPTDYARWRRLER